MLFMIFLYGFRNIGVHDIDQKFSKLHSQLLVALSVTFVFLLFHWAYDAHDSAVGLGRLHKDD